MIAECENYTFIQFALHVTFSIPIYYFPGEFFCLSFVLEVYILLSKLVHTTLNCLLEFAITIILYTFLLSSRQV